MVGPGTPIALKCEYQSNPLGIDVEYPRFSWMVNDESRGAVQTAYQLLVASSADILENFGRNSAGFGRVGIGLINSN